MRIAMRKLKLSAQWKNTLDDLAMHEVDACVQARRWTSIISFNHVQPFPTDHKIFVQRSCLPSYHYNVTHAQSSLELENLDLIVTEVDRPVGPFVSVTAGSPVRVQLLLLARASAQDVKVVRRTFGSRHRRHGRSWCRFRSLGSPRDLRRVRGQVEG